jgi:hypothetical protein
LSESDVLNQIPMNAAPGGSTRGLGGPGADPPGYAPHDRDGERRRRRSDDPITALHYQLSHTRGEGGLDAVVLVDDTGCLVAGAGAWPLCEELAAFAPLIADRSAVGSKAVGTRLAALEPEVFVRSLSLDGGSALLCGRGGDPAPADLIARAADGCRRILLG